MAVEGTVTVEDATIMFRNFEGRADQYNAKGARNFCLALDAETAQNMREDGWNVKQLKVREVGDEPQDYIQVSVKFAGKQGSNVRPPTIVLITSKGRTNVPEDMIDMLDWLETSNVDLIIRPYKWDVNGNTGTKAYLKSIYVTMLEDELALKYASVPEIGTGQLMIENPGDEVWEGEVVEEDEQLAIES